MASAGKRFRANYRQDFDGSGSITFGDVGQARLQLGSTLSAFSEPIAPGSGPQAVAVQVPLPILDGTSEFAPPLSPLASEQLAPIVAEAVRRWQTSGLVPAGVDLAALRFEIRDLGPAYLGLGAANNVILLDDDGAGWGWFVDATPAAEEEFGAALGTESTALAGSAAEGRIDLLTVVMHEIGHALGYPTGGAIGTSAETLMGEKLGTGIRRTVSVAEASANMAGGDVNDPVAYAWGSFDTESLTAAAPVFVWPSPLPIAANSTLDAGLPPVRDLSLIRAFDRLKHRRDATLEKALAAWVPSIERVDDETAFAASIARGRAQFTATSSLTTSLPETPPQLDTGKSMGVSMDEAETPTSETITDSSEPLNQPGANESDPTDLKGRFARAVAKTLGWWRAW